MKSLVISFQSLNGESAGGTGRISFYLARELNNLGILDNLVVSSKGKNKTDFPCQPVSPISKYYLYFLNKILRPLGLPSYIQRCSEEFLFDSFCKNFITNDITILFSTNPYLKRTLRKAQRYGVKTIFFPGNPNENLINKIVNKEYQSMGYKGIDAYTYGRRLTFYNQSIIHFDHIICSNNLILESFNDLVSVSKSFVQGYVPPRLNKNTHSSKAENSTLCFGYLAYSVPLKGLHYLLQAWAKAELSNAKLIIGGPVDKHYDRYIKTKFGHLKNVEFIGEVREIDHFFDLLDFFVSPSLIDGEPVTVIESMQRCVPPIVTDGCGIKDFIKNGENGFVIPVADVNALRDILTFIKNEPMMGEKLGVAASETFQETTFAEFIERLTKKVVDLG